MVGRRGQVRRDDRRPAALQPAGVDRADHHDENDEGGGEEGEEGVAPRVRVAVEAVVVSALELVVESCKQFLELTAGVAVGAGVWGGYRWHWGQGGWVDRGRFLGSGLLLGWCVECYSDKSLCLPNRVLFCASLLRCLVSSCP